MTKRLFVALAALLAFPFAAHADVTLNFGGIASTDANNGVNSVSAATASAEIITDIEVIMHEAIHDFVGDLQITLTNGTSEIIIIGLRDGLSFDGTNTQAGNAGAGTFGSGAHLSGDPDDSPNPLDYTFQTGGADFDMAAEDNDGGGLIPNGVIYAPTAEDSVDNDIGAIQSFAAVFGGQMVAGTWTIDVVDTFDTLDDGSFAGFTVNISSIPEPTSAALLGLGMIGLVAARRRRS